MDAICDLDAFPKVPDTYKETTATGGTSMFVSYVIYAAQKLMLISLQCPWYA